MALPILRRGGSPVRRTDAGQQTSFVNRGDPWNDFEMMDRLFDGVLSPLSLFNRGFASPRAATEMPVELYETGDDLLAFVYAPGLASDGFDISAAGDTITVRAERKPLLEVTEGLVSHTPWGGQATAGGTMSASYTLPVEIDPARVEATYKDGILRIKMPKSEAAKPRQVKVELTP